MADERGLVRRRGRASPAARGLVREATRKRRLDAQHEEEREERERRELGGGKQDEAGPARECATGADEWGQRQRKRSRHSA